MMKKLAGLDETSNEITCDTICVCGTPKSLLHVIIDSDFTPFTLTGFYVFDDNHTTVCPRENCRADVTLLRRPRQLVFVDILQRMRRIYKVPKLAQYMHYAAERDEQKTFYKNDIWDRNPRLRNMPREERRFTLVFSFTADGAETKKNYSTKPATLTCYTAHPVLRYSYTCLFLMLVPFYISFTCMSSVCVMLLSRRYSPGGLMIVSFLPGGINNATGQYLLNYILERLKGIFQGVVLFNMSH